MEALPAFLELIVAGLTVGEVYGLGATFAVGGNVYLYGNGVQDGTSAAFGATGPTSTTTSTLAINFYPGVAARWSGTPLLFSLCLE